MSLSHKSLCTTGKDQYLIIIVPSLPGFRLRPPHLLHHDLWDPIRRSVSFQFPAFTGTSRCCLLFHGGGGNDSTNGVPLFLTNGIYSCKLPL